MTGRNLQIIGLGMASLDILVQTTELPTWDNGVQLDAIAIDGGGPAATAVVAAQRLGLSTGFIGTYGNDRLGQIKKQTLVENGVDLSHSIQVHEAENQVVLVTVNSKSGERKFSSTKKAASPLQPSQLDRNYLAQAEILHLDGYHFQAALEAALWMKGLDKTVVLDGSATNGPISEEMQALVRIADILICGHGFGRGLTSETDLIAAGLKTLEMGPRVVVQTEGEHGCFTVTRQEQFFTPAFDVCSVDTTGAGDVFHGAFLVGLLHHWSLQNIVLFSAAVAAIKCTQLGGRKGIPSFSDALSFLSERGFQSFL
jgi:sugar/nucleoside kinase (ribokinase family)